MAYFVPRLQRSGPTRQYNNCKKKKRLNREKKQVCEIKRPAAYRPRKRATSQFQKTPEFWQSEAVRRPTWFLPHGLKCTEPSSSSQPAICCKRETFFKQFHRAAATRSIAFMCFNFVSSPMQIHHSSPLIHRHTSSSIDWFLWCNMEIRRKEKILESNIETTWSACKYKHRA